MASPSEIYLVTWRCYYTTSLLPDVLGAFPTLQDAVERMTHCREVEWNTEGTCNTFRWREDDEGWALEFASLFQTNVWLPYGHLAVFCLPVGVCLPCPGSFSHPKKEPQAEAEAEQPKEAESN